MKLLVIFLLIVTASAQQWTRVNVATTASFRGLSVVNDKTVWASGTDGTVIRTIDGGTNWSVMTVAGAEKLDFRGIHAFDAQTAVIISSGPAEKGQAQIYRTTDGGKLWTKVFEEKRPGIFFDAVAFWDHKHGIVLSDPVDGRFALFTTDDGGTSWKQIPAAALPPALSNEGAFAASNSCLTVHGSGDVWFATGGASVARAFRSGDRGKTWVIAETPMHSKDASSGIFSLAFSSAKNGVAVGGDYQHPDSSDLPNVMRTVDGGQTWQPAAPTKPAGIYFSSVALGAEQLVAAGIKGLWTKSNSGKSDGHDKEGWKRESDENLNTVRIGHSAVWAVGPKGIVLKKNIRENDRTAHVPM